MSDTKTKAPRWMKIALAASLCLNLLVLGAIGGAILKGGKPGYRQMVGKDPVRGVYRALPRDVQKSLRQNNRIKGASRQERRAWTEDFVAALRAPDFDPTSLEAMFAARTERMTSIAISSQEALIAAISDLSEEARFKLADDFEEGSKRHLGKKKNH